MACYGSVHSGEFPAKLFCLGLDSGTSVVLICCDLFENLGKFKLCIIQTNKLCNQMFRDSYIEVIYACHLYFSLNLLLEYVQKHTEPH